MIKTIGKLVPFYLISAAVILVACPAAAGPAGGRGLSGPAVSRTTAVTSGSPPALSAPGRDSSSSSGSASVSPSVSALKEALLASAESASCRPADFAVSESVSSAAGSPPSAASAPASDAAASGASVSSSCAAASSASPPASDLPSRIVAGYYGSWAAYSGFTPDQIPASRLDVLDYAFADLNGNLTVSLSDPAVDTANFSALARLRQSHPRLKTVISIGGWGNSGHFSDAALTEASRSAFIGSCIDFIRRYGFDGIDIDWEYPVSGASGTPGRLADKSDFTLLMKELRQALDNQGALDGRYYCLTFAGAANSAYAGNVELSALSRYVDYALVMTYDIHGPWDTFTDFNSPLYTPTDSSPQYQWSVDASVQTYLSHGFPAEKLTIGIPFYGYVYTGVTNAHDGLYQPFASGKAQGYDTIAAGTLVQNVFARLFQAQAQVPWLFDGSTFVSYDNPPSVAQKARYAAARRLRGVSVWELSYDRNGALLGPVYSAVH